MPTEITCIGCQRTIEPDTGFDPGHNYGCGWHRHGKITCHEKDWCSEACWLADQEKGQG